MPYSVDKPSELPENVKKLGGKLQKLWVATWNSVYRREKDEGTAFRVANKMVKQAKTSSEDGDLEQELTEEQIEAFVAAELEEKPSRNYLNGLRERLKKLKGQKLDDSAIDHIMRSAAGSAGASRRNANRVASEITDYAVLYSLAEAPDSFNVLPIPGTYKHPSYGNIKITKQRNQHFVDNFNAGVYQNPVPVDAEHETKLSGAMGWITELSMNDDGSVDAKVDWTDRGKEAIEDDRFKYISPEWYDEWQDPVSGNALKDVLIGAALTSRPFFKDPNLKPLVASELTIDDTWEDVESFREIPDDMSFDDLRNQAGQQLRERMGSDVNNVYPYVVDMSATHVIYCDNTGQDFRAPYTLSDGSVEVDFGEAKPVERLTMWRAASDDQKNNLTNDDPAILKKEQSKTSQPDADDVHVKKPVGGKAMIEVKDLKAFAEDASYQAATPEERNEWLQEKLGEALEQVATSNQAAEEARKASEQSQTEASQRMQAAEEKIASLQAESRTARFSAMVKEGAWIGDRDKHLAMLNTLAEAQGEDSEIFKSYCEQQDTLGKRYRESGVFAEIGSSEKVEPTSAYREAVKAYREANPKATEAEASAAVITANPQFYTEHQARMRKAASEDRGEIVSLA